MNNNYGSASASAVANAGAGKSRSTRRNALTKVINNIRQTEESIKKRNDGKYRGKKNLNTDLAKLIAKRNALTAKKHSVNELTNEHKKAKAVGKELYAKFKSLPTGDDKERIKMEYLAVKAKVDDLEARIRETKGLKSVATNTTKKAKPSVNVLLSLPTDKAVALLEKYKESVMKGVENSSRVKAARAAAAEIKKAAAEMRDACKKECEERYKIEKAKAEEIVEKAKRNNA